MEHNYEAFLELKELYRYMWNDMKRPKMSSPNRNDTLDDIRIELEMDEDLIVGNLSYLVGGSMPPNIQVENALKLPEIFFGYIKKIKSSKIEDGNKEYSKQLINFIEDLKRINDKIIILKFQI
ncbi:MAG: hypothetical protein NTY12_01795 [Candidatus Falkowbacteria bacterium]|nr:hypothetical protein [Candidatus Falkowbacteria bacterium]